MTAEIQPVRSLTAALFAPEPADPVEGVAAVTNLPAGIAQRMSGRARNLLSDAGLASRIVPLRERGAGPGAGLFLWLPGGGFSSLGRKGLPADQVAAVAVAETVAFIENKALADRHLADQLLLPLALAEGTTRFTTDQLTDHSATNAGLLQEWLGLEIVVDGQAGEPAMITAGGIGWEAG